MKNNSKAYFLIIAAVIIWSLSGLLVKTVNVDPLWISLIRCLGGGIFLLPYIFKEKYSFWWNIYGEGLREVSIEKAMIICLAEPVLNPLWVYLGKGEIPSMTIVIDSILILLSAIVDIAFSIKNNKKAKKLSI